MTYDYHIIHYTNCEQIKEKLTTLHRSFFHHEFRKSFSVKMYIENTYCSVDLPIKTLSTFYRFPLSQTKLKLGIQSFEL